MDNRTDYVNNLRESLKENLVQEKISEAKVSVIVPTYNVEKYIEKCLNSLIKQTLKELEIICIDDGSTDLTTEIIKSYAEIDTRIKLVIQGHQRQGAARNLGMKEASGEYIGFVDSDDWVDLDYFEKLYNAAKKYNSDIALADYIRIGNGQTKVRLGIDKEELYTDLDGKFGVCKQAKQPSPANKIYRIELLRRENLEFREGVYCEDKIFTCKAVYYANSVVSVPGTYYYYYRRSGSTVKTKSRRHHRYKVRANRDVLEFLKEQNVQLKSNDFWAVKKDYRKFGIKWYLIKESLKSEKHYLFGVIPFLELKK